MANTGVHGANRLASNSLLEAIVFGKQVGECIKKNPNLKIPALPAGRQLTNKLQNPGKEVKAIISKKNKLIFKKIKNDIKKMMWEKVGIVRKKNELLEALKQFRSFKNKIEKIRIERGISRELLEANNLIEVALAITQAALNRPKSLGAHYVT